MDSTYFNIVNPDLPPLNPPSTMTAILLTDSELAFRTNLSPSVSINNLNYIVIPVAASPMGLSSPWANGER